MTQATPDRVVASVELQSQLNWFCATHSTIFTGRAPVRINEPSMIFSSRVLQRVPGAARASQRPLVRSGSRGR
jgi:hypothetical protein